MGNGLPTFVRCGLSPVAFQCCNEEGRSDVRTRMRILLSKERDEEEAKCEKVAQARASPKNFANLKKSQPFYSTAIPTSEIFTSSPSPDTLPHSAPSQLFLSHSTPMPSTSNGGYKQLQMRTSQESTIQIQFDQPRTLAQSWTASPPWHKKLRKRSKRMSSG